MRQFCALVVLFGPLGFMPRAADAPCEKSVPKAEAAQPGNLYIVAIGQEPEWNFLPQGFERAMRDQGKGLYREIHSRVLIGGQATRKHLLEGVAWMVENAKAEDLVMVFIACHGSCTKEGESVFATRKGSVRPREIKKELAKLPCHAIVVNDACCSGNWPKEFDGDPMPANVTALCCCLPTQESGIEFDITLFEALYGKADFNADGSIDLDEVIKYCGLRINEVQGGKLTPVFHKAKNLKAAPILTQANPKVVSVVHRNEVFSAIVEKEEDGKFEVRVIGFSDRAGPFFMPRTFARDHVILPKEGAPLMVQKDRWRPARLLGKDGDDLKIRLIGPDAGEEVLNKSRVRHLFAGNPGEAFPAGLFTKR